MWYEVFEVLLFVGLCWNIYDTYTNSKYQVSDEDEWEYESTLGELKVNQVFYFESNPADMYIMLNETEYQLVEDDRWSWTRESWNQGVRVVVQGVMSDED